MKKFITIIVAGLLLTGLTLMLSRRDVPDTDTAGLKTYYGTVIDRVITECMKKSRLRSGRFERASVFNCFKATFFKLHRDRLIEELVDKRVGKSEFLTRYRLNRSFYQAIRELAPPVMGDAH